MKPKSFSHTIDNTPEGIEAARVARINDREFCWKRFHLYQSMAERRRLVKTGVIVPNHSTAQLLVRNPNAKGGWSPQIKVVG